MQHRDHGPTGRSEITGDGQHELLVAYVQVGRWFVEQDRGRALGEYPGQADPRLFPTGQAREGPCGKPNHRVVCCGSTARRRASSFSRTRVRPSIVTRPAVGFRSAASNASSSARRTARSTVETRYDETDEPDDAAQGNRCTGTECRQDDHRQPDPFRMEAEVTRFPLAQDERVERLGKGRYRHDAGQQER